MKLGAPFLMDRFQNPNEWKEAILHWLEINYGNVIIPKIIAENTLFHNLSLVTVTQAKFFTDVIAGAANSNLQGGSLRATNEHFIICGIRFLQGANATLAATAWSYGSTTADTRNGVITIQNNTDTVLRNMPFTMFNPNLTTEDQGILWLTEPLLWLGNTPFIITADFPIITSTANLNGRFELLGFGLIA